MSHDLESVWELREETLYPRLFGPVSNGIFVLEPSDFANFGASEGDPRWLHLGVLEFPPTATRPTWLYVTSGGSTPWEQEPEEYDPQEYSWLGVELLIETVAQADWAIRLLKRLLAFHVLAMHDHFGDRPGIDYGSRMPVGGAIDASGSALEGVLAIRPEHIEATQVLPSGKFDLIKLVGVSSAEIAFAKASGNDALLAKLADAKALAATDPRRPCLMASE